MSEGTLFAFSLESDDWTGSFLCEVLNGAEIYPAQITDSATRRATLTIYSENQAEAQSALARVQALLTNARGIAVDQVTVSPIAELPRVDWAESWKQNFPPLRVSDEIIVLPPWEPVPSATRCVVVIDPGMSFGTGHHPTTHTCLSVLGELASSRPGMSFLDCGCGSGILSIAAAKLGFQDILAIDIDDHAVRCTDENAEVNGVGAAITAQQMDLTQVADMPQRDLVIANILADPLTAMAPLVAHSVASGGVLVLSGLLATQFQQVASVYANHGFRCQQERPRGDWLSGVFTRE